VRSAVGGRAAAIGTVLGRLSRGAPWD
jgi:hypothetical protein